MTNSAPGQRLFTVSIEGVPMVLDQMGLANEVVAQFTLGESQEALVVATPEQVARLRELLHVRSVEPVSNGLYADRSGKWFAVKNDEVIQSGSWMVPLEVLQSVSQAEPKPSQSQPINDTLPASSGSSVSEAAPARETDPVCGAVMRPGQEAANVNYQGHTYHFCSDECRKLFLARPNDYVSQKALTA